MSISITDVENIADRESFIAFRAAWRTAYATASQNVRNAKKDIRDLVHDRRSGAVSKDAADGWMPGMQYDRHMARKAARTMMWVLEQGKKRRDALVTSYNEATTS